MKILHICWLLLAIVIGGCQGSDGGGDPVSHNDSGIALYGWYAQDYTANNNDLAELAQYTDTIFASDQDQARIAVEAGFKNVFYRYEHYQILERMTEIPTDPEIFRTHYFQAYREFLQDLRTTLIDKGLYQRIDYFFIADEPALHRDVFLDQAFLDQYVTEFDRIFPDKQSAIAFAEDPNGDGRVRGHHLYPPPTLDLLIMDPYFWTNDLPCNAAEIRNYLYENNQNSNLNWAFQFGKPVMLAGDAMLRRDETPRKCYVEETYRLAREDKRITGLVWFIYDASFNQQDGLLRGASNDPQFIDFIRNLTAP